jgi:hypothetical protein
VASLLDFSQFIGGSDNIQVEVSFPSSQRTVVYDFGQSISGWSFILDHQTVVADTISYDRNTGAPNFASTKLIGTFPTGVISTGTYVQVLNASSGTVAVTIPAGLYTGPIIPDARSHTPITVVGFTWISTSTPAQVATHRWGLLQSWEPGVEPGDPILDADYTPITVGA